MAAVGVDSRPNKHGISLIRHAITPAFRDWSPSNKSAVPFFIFRVFFGWGGGSSSKSTETEASFFHQCVPLILDDRVFICGRYGDSDVTVKVSCISLVDGPGGDNGVDSLVHVNEERRIF